MKQTPHHRMNSSGEEFLIFEVDKIDTRGYNEINRHGCRKGKEVIEWVQKKKEPENIF